MYDYIKGTFSYKSISSKGAFAVVEAAGVGYILEILPRDYELLPQEGENIKVFSVLLHREDKMSLCGFLRREDRDIFNVLTSVSGVGSKMALTLLNSFKVKDLIGFVLDGDYKELTKAKGVGPKLAQKIILELKDKLTSYQSDSVSIPKGNTISSGSQSQNAQDAQMVLVSLGYEKNEINNAITKALNSLPEGAAAEEILKKALQILSV
ncbi:Holliday junction branch migration protein RuvA [bacterium]|nr:Holliday junction branch migration protein RuvA [bacterium]